MGVSSYVLNLSADVKASSGEQIFAGTGRDQHTFSVSQTVGTGVSYTLYARNGSGNDPWGLVGTIGPLTGAASGSVSVSAPPWAQFRLVWSAAHTATKQVFKG